MSMDADGLTQDALVPLAPDDVTPSLARRELSATQVAAWIYDHPDFLSENRDLLLSVAPPARFPEDSDGKIADLQQAMIRKLQAESERQARLGRALLKAGQSNQDAQARTHRAVLALVEARGLDSMLARLTGSVAEVLGVSAVAIGVESPEGTRPPATLSKVAALSPGAVDRLIGVGRETRLRAQIDRTQGLPPGPFGPMARQIRSDALVRLRISRAAPALLALGSIRPDMFEADQATDLLRFLAGVVERLIAQWLDLPPA